MHLDDSKVFWLSKLSDSNIILEEQMISKMKGEDLHNELKSDLRGRSVLILVEMAFLNPQKSNASYLSDKLNIPLSTIIFEIKKLLKLEYIQLTISTETLLDNRVKYYSFTSKGIVFLKFLNETITRSVENLI